MLPLLPMGYFWLHILEYTVIEDIQQIRAALKQSLHFFPQKVKC